MQAIDGDVRLFIVDNFLFGNGEKDIAEDESFLDRGIIDSTGVLELVAFLERTYGIEVEDEELVPDNLDSIRKVTAYVERKLAERREDRAA